MKEHMNPVTVQLLQHLYISPSTTTAAAAALGIGYSTANRYAGILQDRGLIECVADASSSGRNSRVFAATDSAKQVLLEQGASYVATPAPAPKHQPLKILTHWIGGNPFAKSMA